MTPSPSDPGPKSKAPQRRFQAPKGTRDMYPEDLLRRRYLTQVWRDTAIRHGFDEIDGPTFEESGLYAVKSGEGILGELFQAFSGKSPEEVERVRETGMAPFALRPEFTPTLARMYAARAKQLPQPTKWFSIGPYFRAERPQRGRLREFLQWNVDVMGGEGLDAEGAEQDAETIESCVAALDALGFDAEGVRVHLSSRTGLSRWLAEQGLPSEHEERALQLIDRRDKAPPDAFAEQWRGLGMTADALSAFEALAMSRDSASALGIAGLIARLGLGAVGRRVVPDASIARGLAYYSGAVFEARAQGERAVAGGGRYDGLIELLGGPPTPAVGFAMGDVVVSLLLEDKGLMPQGAELMEAVSGPCASVRPEAFVISADERLGDPHVTPLVARLRRGVESAAWLERAERKPWARDRYAGEGGGVRPLHARQTYKSTTNLKKLLADAERQHARFAVVVHDEHKVQLKDLDRREDLAHATRGDFSVDPASEAYVGRAIAERLAG